MWLGGRCGFRCWYLVQLGGLSLCRFGWVLRFGAGWHNMGFCGFLVFRRLIAFGILGCCLGVGVYCGFGWFSIASVLLGVMVCCGVV